MATLKEAVESGRRWRFRYTDGVGGWMRAGHDPAITLNTVQALSSDFEIEAEPEKPREWTIHSNEKGTKLHACTNLSSIYCWPEKDWQIGDKYIRVHDADACDRLHLCQSCGTRFRCPHQCEVQR